MVFIIYAVITKRTTQFPGAGSFLLCSAADVAYPYQVSQLVSNGIWRDSAVYYEIGVTIELIFFLIALAFKKPRRF